MAIPSAPPSSPLVSDIPVAAPACSGGALPTMSSVASVITGARPSEITIEAMMISTMPVLLSSPKPTSTTVPTAAMAIPTPMITAGGKRWMILGAMTEPTMKPAADGSDHTAASIGDSPSTSCRYCAMKRK
jgi:hypothetical protein